MCSRGTFIPHFLHLPLVMQLLLIHLTALAINCAQRKMYSKSLSHTNKASGLDDISAKILKSTAVAISLVLSTLFNISISTGTVPDCWKVSLVTPVPKQGKPSDPSNYRPISSLPIISKVLERIILGKLCDP